MGRRWGKSTLGGTLSLACAARGAKVAWVVPTYKNGRPLWRWAEGTAAPLKRAGVQISRTDRVITFPSGGFLGIYSADNADAMRGEAFHLAIVDEAARVEAEVYTDVLQPTLADYDGRCMLISTPRGRNWFWEEWQRGQTLNTDVKSWKAPTSANPNPRIQRAALLAKDRVPDVTYQQEWLAEFAEDGLTLFRIADVDAATHGAWGDILPVPGHEYVTGVDIGRRHDATVITTVDVTALPYQRVASERLERIAYPIIQQRIEERTRAYPGKTWVEYNGVGDPVIENLDVQVETFVTTAKSKANALQALQLLFERHELKAMWTPRERKILIGAAWDDDHTADEVMSLAITAHGIASQMPVQVFL